MTLRVGSLFSGIGGFDLGLERAGMRVVWQCEADAFCRSVLARHWPNVTCYPDVRELRGADVEPVDVLCGGFPCQDISLAGRGAGIEGARSGLWGEYARLIREIRPSYVIVENVAALLARGLGTVLGDLAACGYDAEWDCIPASAVGAPHRRDRLWLVAYPSGARRREDAGGSPCDEGPDEGRASQDDHFVERDGQGGGARLVADAEREGQLQPRRPERQERRRAGDGGSEVADAYEVGRQRSRSSVDDAGWPESSDGSAPGVADTDSESSQRPPVTWDERDPWAVEPDVGRMAHGIPGRMDRIGALGNALVPQIAEWLGARILEYEREFVTCV